MSSAPVAAFVEALRQQPLLEPDQATALAELQVRFADPKALARELMQLGWLTPYQANQLLQGRGQDLVLGQYVLLERLGEGGMGAVFKARHQTLDRIVALKLIRKERLVNAEAVRRFRREIRAAAQLNHPHIVLAFDADEARGIHFFTMEFVEGIDLHKWVKEHGPLPIDRACDCIRQTALGLQHAHERGLVHRDIKPSNLLLGAEAGVRHAELPSDTPLPLQTALRTVRILDMGLARLGAEDDSDKTSTLTQEGTIMGTPDYLAPEQAQAAHAVDIRADLYSLGCTFYYLLTGKLPFPGGSAFDKMFRHRLEEPRALEQLRPEVPPKVVAVVRKLMAKKPEDRYQTPGEVAAVLQKELDWLRGDDGADGKTPVTPAPPPATPAPQPAVAVRHQRRQAERRRLLWLNVAGSGLLLTVGGLLLFLFLRQQGPGAGVPKTVPLVAESSEAEPKPPTAFESWCRDVARMSGEDQVRAVARRLADLNPGFDREMRSAIEAGVVTSLTLSADHVQDLTPVQALTGLNQLICRGSTTDKGILADLAPLKGLRLTTLNITFTNVADLSPVKDMPLTMLVCMSSRVSSLEPLRGKPMTAVVCSATPVSDLSPLQGMPLVTIELYSTAVKDLSPLRGAPLEYLSCNNTPVNDLSPLKDAKLTVLNCGATLVQDLSPIKGMKLTKLNCRANGMLDLSPIQDAPLKEIHCDFLPWRHTATLRSMKTLQSINEKPVADFWKEVDARQATFDAWVKSVAQMPAAKQVEAVAARLREHNPEFNLALKPTISDGAVTGLAFSTNRLLDLSPLQALPRLTQVSCPGNAANRGQLADLAPFRGLALEHLDCPRNRVADLTPLKGMHLKTLDIHDTLVADLTPLAGMPLTSLKCADTRVTDLRPLQGMPLEQIDCDFVFQRDADLLRTIKTLTKINGKPAAVFLKPLGTPGSKTP